MISARNLAISIFWVALSTALIHAQDLSRYREFQFGMNLIAVAKQADVKTSDARVIHQRPAVIQELEWRPRSLAGSPTHPGALAFREELVKAGYREGENVIIEARFAEGRQERLRQLVAHARVFLLALQQLLAGGLPFLARRSSVLSHGGDTSVLEWGLEHTVDLVHGVSCARDGC